LSGILCNCQAVQRYLANLGVSDSVLKVIYKGHLPQWYQHANSRSRSEFQLSADDFVIGIVANVRPLKGIDVLLHAFKALENQTAKLIVVGALRGEALPAIADELGIATRVQFTGYLSDVISLYPLFDVFVMPSVEREGFPKAVIEAASCAVPAIVSDVGGMPEIVEDGFTGYVVPPADVGALKSAIGRIQELPDRGAALGQAARARVEQKFHFSTFCDQVESWFTELSSAS
jgi:glycosyltransferase involved in cell wall biosynthesis